MKHALTRLIAVVGCAVALSVLSALPVLAGDPALVRGADDPELEWGPCPEFFPASCEIAVLHGDPAEPNADIFFKVPANTDLPEHWHTSAERMVLVSGEMEVDYRGQDEVLVTTGDYAYGPPELPHSASCKDAGPCVLFIAFEQPVDAFATEGDKH